MLTIEPENGLCNRMRAIDSAAALAQDIDRPLRVIWRRNEALGAPFDALFQHPDEIAEIVPQLPKARKRSLLGLRRRPERKEPEQIITSDAVVEMVRNGDDFTSLRHHPRPHISTCYRFHRRFGVRRLFKPTAALQSAIDALTAPFGHCIGVHIRRGDDVFARKHSPTALFTERMGKALAERSDAQFFLATDDPETAAMLADLFPGRVTMHRKRSYDRESVSAIEDAVIDLFCLAKTKKIFGSAGSSFSEMAAELGGIPLEIVAEHGSEEVIAARLGPQRTGGAQMAAGSDTQARPLSHRPGA